MTLPSDGLQELLKATASVEEVQRSQALTQFFDALVGPIREGVMDGANHNGIFTMSTLPAGVTPEFPIDFVQPGTEDEFRAFTNPGKGRPPALAISGDRILLSPIRSIFSVQYDLEYARTARWDILSRLTEVFMASFIAKRNDDAWHTILAAAADRGATVYDIDASTGQFTRKLFSLARCFMKRNSGGNTTSLKKGRLTDVYLSCEGIEEILNWDLGQVPDSVRAQMYSVAGGDNTTLDILRTRLHDLEELGEGQEYQSYYVNKLGGALVPSGGGHSADDDELAIGLDLVNRDSFVMANVQPLEMYEDKTIHSQQLGGWYGWEQYAIGVLDNRRVVSISY